MSDTQRMLQVRWKPLPQTVKSSDRTETNENQSSSLRSDKVHRDVHPQDKADGSNGTIVYQLNQLS